SDDEAAARFTRIVADASPRCIGLPKICGPTSDDDCCTSPPVDGGTFYRFWHQDDGGLPPDGSGRAHVSSFHLDRYEVTVGRYRGSAAAFRASYPESLPDAGASTSRAEKDPGWNPAWAEFLTPATVTFPLSQSESTYYESVPIRGVSW